MNSWFKKAKVGLFIHFGINTGNMKYHEKIMQYETFDAFEKAVNDGGWNAEKWVDAARKMRASYITFAIFHSCLGYIKAWKSNIPGTYTTKRDFLGELIEEANKYDIKVILYISGDTTGNKFFAEQPWIFPDEYAEYKNDSSVDISTDRHWQSIYCKDIIGEVIDNYPDLAGFWFDGWNNLETNEMLFSFIHSKNPALLTMRNNFGDQPGPGEDVMSIECFGKKLDPPFDYASGAWHPPGNKEYCYVIPGLSDWYQIYEPGEYDKNNAIRNFISVITNGWAAHIGLGPDIGGNFNGSMGEFINEFDNFLTWAGESVFDTAAGGLETGHLNGGAYALACQKDNAVYIHVLLPPKGNVLIIKDGGRIYSEAINIRTGQSVPFSQKEGLLHIAGEFRRHCDEDGDTVIKLVINRSGEPCVYPNPCKHEVQQYMQPLPADIVIQTDKPVQGILLHQDDTSAITKGGWAAPHNNRAKDYSLYTSDDGICYTLFQQGQLSGARGIKQISLPGIKTAFIKLRIETAFDTSDGLIGKFINGAWEYRNSGGEQPKSEVIIEGQRHIRDEQGRVCVWGAEGNNVYIIGRGAEGVAADTDGKLLAVMPPEKGRLRISHISIIT
ncbi:MAG: alpha-L-fucosidase [Defluviitaleaceae bacterium]|nr:alpha-L-fucosidase [Defluviitaleaceae bacterium]MCL2836239.1 alpha-L-fucosidase [Defluviitaleaceae bacterium]